MECVTLGNPLIIPIEILGVCFCHICDQIWIISHDMKYCGYVNRKCEKCGFLQILHLFQGKNTIFHIVLNTLDTKLDTLCRL